MPARALIVRIAIALGMASVGGCALLSPAPPEEATAFIAKMPAGIPRREPSAFRLLVFAPDTSPVYDTTQMAYAVRPYEVAYFSRHQWGDTPARMLQALLLQTLERTGYFTAVLTPPYAGGYSYALRTEVVELVQDFTSERPALRLSLRLRLRDGATDRLVATKEIALREPMREKAPYAGVVAANDAAAEALREIAAFVLDKAN